MTKTTIDLPPAGSTGALTELQVGPGDVVRYHFPGMNPGDLRTVANVVSFGYYMTDSIHPVVNDQCWTLISRAMPQTPHIVVHEGRTYDLTALETPFGLLLENARPVADALKAWPHGWERYCQREDKYGWFVDGDIGRYPATVLRARPAPVETRVNCARFGHGEPYEYGTCIKRADGSIDWATWEPQAWPSP